MSSKKQLWRCGKLFLKRERNKQGTIGIFTINGRQTKKLKSTRTPDLEQAIAIAEEFNLEQRCNSRLKEANVLEILNWYYLKYGINMPSADMVKYTIKAVEESLFNEDLKRHPLVSEMGAVNQLKFIKYHRPLMRPESKKSTKMVRRFSDATIDRYLGVVWSAINIAVEDQEYKGEVPVRISRKRPGWKPIFRNRKRVLTLQEWANLFNKAAMLEHRWRYMISALCSGGRPTTVLKVMRPQVNLRYEIVELQPEEEFESNKRKPTVPMAPAWAEWMRRWMAEDQPDSAEGHIITYEGRPLATKTKTFFRNMVRQIDPTITPYTIRHSIATWLANQAVDKWERSCFMGHAKPDGNSQDDYTHYDPRYLRNAAVAIQKLLEAIAPLVTARPLLPPPRAKELHIVRTGEVEEVVGATGIEPVTSCVSSKRSTAELRAQGPTVLPAWQVRGNTPDSFLYNQEVKSGDHHHVKVLTPEKNQQVTINYRVSLGTKNQ